MRMSGYQAIALGMLGLLVLLALPLPGDAQTTLERVKREGVARIGVAGEVPFGYRASDGRVTGESPEIARAVLSRIDPAIEVEGVITNWGSLIPELQDGRFDIITAGMFITPERCAEVSFSDPTYVIGEAFAVKKGNPKKITNYKAISNHRDARVGLISGTVEYNYAMVTGIPADRALLYFEFDEAIEALKAGEVDAVGLTALSARNLVDDEPELEATEQFFPNLDGSEVKGYGAFAFRKEDQALVDAFNEHLEDFIGSEEHWDLVEEFGFFPDMAPDKTAAELCQG